MKFAIIAGSCALLLQAGSAAAGPCAAEIENVAKTLASKDAGSGPTAGAAGTSRPQHPPTAAMSEADKETTASRAAAESNRPQHPPTTAMNEAASGERSAQPDKETQKTPGQHPPTAAMSRATQGAAASSEDVRRQTEGKPTAAQQAEGMRPADERGRTAAFSELDRARVLDRDGKEAECMDAVRSAKQHAG